MNIFENDSTIINNENYVVANGHGVLIYIPLKKFQKIVSTFSYNVIWRKCSPKMAFLEEKQC